MDTLVNEVRAEILAECGWVVDSGHEWLQVPIRAARFADRMDRIDGGEGISAFSYVNGVLAYLEGDCDAAIFFNRFDVSDHEEFSIALVSVYNEMSPVRNYPRWGAA
jgi:hypothetical protein